MQVCMRLVGERFEVPPSDREVSARTIRQISVDTTDNDYWLALRYMTMGLLPQTPLTVTLQTSAWPTPTVVLKKILRTAGSEEIFQPLSLPLGEQITVTVTTREFAAAPGAGVAIDLIAIVPSLAPRIDAVQLSSDVESSVLESPSLESSVEESSSASMATDASIDLSIENTIASTLAVTVTGAHFAAPLIVSIGNVVAQSVTQLDDNTLVANFALPLPPGLQTLFVTNRAGTAEATTGGKHAAVSAGVRAYIPVVQIRATPFRR